MALNDLKVYHEYAYKAASEILRQNVSLFNAASRNAIQLAATDHRGSFSENAYFQHLSGLVRGRDPRSNTAVEQKHLKQIAETMVKIGRGTPEIRIDPSQFRWIQMNPEVAGAQLGQQLAAQMMQDMLNTSLGALRVALAEEDAVVHAIEDKLDWRGLNRGASKFGDSSNALVVWAMHSTPMHDLYDNNLANQNTLFSFETINVSSDPFGRVLIASDSPALTEQVNTGTEAEPVMVDSFSTLGLTSGAVTVGQNNDFDANESTTNGRENIQRSYQAEWSWQLGLKGFTWERATGGEAPTDDALFSGANWTRIATSHKDLPGVIVTSR